MRGLAIAIAIVLGLTALATATAAGAQAAAASPGQKYFGDIKLLNQDGQEMNLYSDLMRGRTVVINVMFTTCTGACPVMSATIEKIQTHLGDRVGKDVRLVSISVDPVHDTPAKLKEYAARFHAKPGWVFLTGSKTDVESALRKLGQWVDDPSDHQTLFLIGNDRTGLWKKAFALAPTDQIFPVVDSVVDDKGQG